MDKNTLTGILLIGAIFIAFLYLNQPEPNENKQAVKKEESLKTKDVNDKKSSTELSNNSIDTTIVDSIYSDSIHIDSVNVKELDSKKEEYGIFYTALEGEKEYYTLKNNKISIRISNKGGRIVDVSMIEKDSLGICKYRTHADFIANKNVPLKLFEEGSSDQNLRVKVKDQYDDPIPVNTRDFYFNLDTLKSSDSSLIFNIKTEDPSKTIQFSYVLSKNKYHVDYSIEYINLGNEIDFTDVGLNWSMKGLSTEKLASDERMTATLMYRYLGEGRDYLTERSNSEEKLNGLVNWVAFKHKFFSSILISEEGLNGGKISQSQLEDDKYTVFYNSEATLPALQKTELKFFFGPNEYDLLLSYENEMDGIINLGWGIFRWVNQIMIAPIFNLLLSTGLSLGLIILLVTLIVKLIILPLTYKNYKSTAKMKVLKPEIEKINKKYEGKTDKDVMMKKQKETMGLYKQTGVNPMSGCIPMLIQMPILLAVFRFFPSSIDLRHKGFLWAEDLSSYDAIVSWTTEIPILSSMYGNHVSLFTLLMAISTLFYTLMNSSQMNTSQPGMPNMKVIMYIFPFIMLFFFNTYSSGLSYYYLCGNLMNLGIMWAIKKYMIDENKIKLQIEENKKKPKKKSKFQQRMEDMAKQQNLRKR